jgi:hypothetical protein
VDSADQITLAVNATDGVANATTAYATLNESLRPIGGAIVKNTTIEFLSGSAKAHGIAAFTTGMVVENCTVIGADWGIVVKRPSVDVINCKVYDCSVENIAITGCSNVLVKNNFSSNSVNGDCYFFASHQASDTAFRNIVTNNIAKVPAGTGKCFKVTEDQWDTYWDYNIYDTTYSAIATFLATPNLIVATSLAQVQAGWAGVETVNNSGFDHFADINDTRSKAQSVGSLTGLWVDMDGDGIPEPVGAVQKSIGNARGMNRF